MNDLPLFHPVTPISDQYSEDAQIVLASSDVNEFITQIAEYIAIARQRLGDYFNGTLRHRPLGRPVHQPSGAEKVSRIPEEWKEVSQVRLLEQEGDYE